MFLQFSAGHPALPNGLRASLDLGSSTRGGNVSPWNRIAARNAVSFEITR